MSAFTRFITLYQTLTQPTPDYLEQDRDTKLAPSPPPLCHE